mmetsp:Transcript_81494/g.195502  ORF Transcript_81494/g.195502 Transcript_81494/m.195502 type:complete len:99 (+) Transcript_81494:269-565(+)
MARTLVPLQATRNCCAFCDAADRVTGPVAGLELNLSAFLLGATDESLAWLWLCARAEVDLDLASCLGMEPFACGGFSCRLTFLGRSKESEGIHACRTG